MYYNRLPYLDLEGGIAFPIPVIRPHYCLVCINNRLPYLNLEGVWMGMGMGVNGNENSMETQEVR